MRLSRCSSVLVQQPTSLLKVREASIVLFILGSVTLDQSGVAAELGGRDCVEYQTTNSGLINKLCAGRASLVEVGQNTTIALEWIVVDPDNLTDVINLEVYVEHENIAETPPHVSIDNDDSTERLHVTGVKAGKTVVSFGFAGNETNKSASHPISQEMLTRLKREVSFVNSLPLDIVAIIIGWTYAIVWVMGYYPQTYHSCKRRSVVGFDFNYVGMNFTSHLAYLSFNAGLYWIPEVQEEYFRRHPEGVNPVQLNDVIFSIHATISVSIWILQCIFLERDGQRISYIGGFFIGTQWLVILICLLMGALGFLKWLDALTYISFVTLATTLVWINFRRKSTEGFSPLYNTLNLIGGAFSLLQMLMIAYNYDDWKSIFGDPTKFGYGLITVGFPAFHFIQHYFLYRKAWMKKYKLSVECECSEIECKHFKSKKSVRSTVVLPDEKVILKSIEYFV